MGGLDTDSGNVEICGIRMYMCSGQYAVLTKAIARIHCTTLLRSYILLRLPYITLNKNGEALK